VGLYPGSVDSPTGATVYGPMGDHGHDSYKLILHTTETKGMPSFGGGDTAPHYVYDPTSRVWTMWAEFWDGRVGTMKGHSTNHANDDAFQVEILAYSDTRYDPWVGDFTDDNYQDLADFYAWAMTEYPIDRDVTPTPNGGWIYGSSASTRGTESQYNTFSGLSCHGWVYGNSHYDVGVLDLQRIHDLATGDNNMTIDYDKIRTIVHEEVVAVLGGDAIEMPYDGRIGNQGIVNSVWWSKLVDERALELLWNAGQTNTD